MIPHRLSNAARPLALAAAALFVVFLGALSALAAGAAKPDPKARIARGRYLTTIGGCNDCHTPWKFNPELQMPEPDFSRQLSGHPVGAPDPAAEYKANDIAVIGATFTAFRLPFGTVYAANLTPDKATGLGEWTEKMFMDAIRKGKHMGGDGRAILPPMPWPMYRQMTDEDLKSVFAFLQSLPAIKNEVPAPKVPDAVVEQISVNFKKMIDGMDKAAGAKAAPQK